MPAALKEAADAYASQRGKTLTGAVADLLDRGLNAASDEWPDGIDLAPEPLYDRARAHPLIAA